MLNVSIIREVDGLHISVNIHGWTSELFLAMGELALVAAWTGHGRIVATVLEVWTHLQFVQVLVVHCWRAQLCDSSFYGHVLASVGLFAWWHVLIFRIDWLVCFDALWLLLL